MNSYSFGKESESLDYKREYPKNNVDLIHDILCLGDTNTPLKECSDELFIERMFRERFGIDKSPLERIKLSLRNINNWKWGENEKNEEYFYDELNPEFLLYRSHESSKFIEGWNLSFPDSKAFKYELFLKFHDTLLKRLFLISCDGERYLTILPEHWLKQNTETNYYYESHFFLENSLEYLVNEMIQQVHPVQKLNRGWLQPFPVFSSPDSAKTAFESDYKMGMLEYIYYFFDRQLQCYFKIKNGKPSKIITI